MQNKIHAMTSKFDHAVHSVLPNAFIIMRTGCTIQQVLDHACSCLLQQALCGCSSDACA